MGAAYGRGAASNSEGVRATHPALHNGSSQAANPPGHHPTALDFGANPVLFWAASGQIGMPNFSLEKRCQRTAPSAMRPAPAVPLHARPCPPMPMPCSKISLKQGISPHDDQKRSCQLCPRLCMLPRCSGGLHPQPVQPQG